MFLQICFGAVRTAFLDLWRDLKSTRWLRGWAWSAGVIWFLGLLVCLVFIGILPLFTYDHNACQPDGSFRLHPETYSMWSSTGFFQITLGGGNLTFAQAKVVDIVWDIGVGRGGQLLLAIISWREFARYLTICMEHEPVTYQLFRTIFIENDASVLSTCRTIKSFIRQRRLRSNVAMAFITATMVFILAFPTLVSAMSGYDSNVASRIEDLEKNLVPFNSYSRVLYVIHDGWRIDQTGNYWITDLTNEDDPIVPTEPICTRYGHTSSYHDHCELVLSVSQYVETYGLGGVLNENTTFNNPVSNGNVTISAPTLNISAYTSEDKRLGGQNSTEVLSQSWVRDNQTFNYAYITEHGKCQNTGDYQWGFSFLQLFICIVLLVAWTLGIYIMWIYTHYTLALRNRLPEEISGEHRAVLELAAAMQTELDVEHIDPLLLREKQLRKRIEKEIRGGAISYAYPDSTPKSHSIRKGLKAWFKAEKWWFLAMFTTTAICLTFWMFAFGLSNYGALYLWGWLFSVWFGQFWAFCIGKTIGSRLLIVLFWSLVGAVATGGFAIASMRHGY